MPWNASYGLLNQEIRSEFRHFFRLKRQAQIQLWCRFGFRYAFWWQSTGVRPNLRSSATLYISNLDRFLPHWTKLCETSCCLAKSRIDLFGCRLKWALSFLGRYFPIRSDSGLKFITMRFGTNGGPLRIPNAWCDTPGFCMWLYFRERFADFLPSRQELSKIR